MLKAITMILQVITIILLLFIAVRAQGLADPGTYEYHEPKKTAQPVFDSSALKVERDNFDYDRSIEITIESKTIDSLQTEYDNIVDELYMDKKFRACKDFFLSDKLRYMDYLLEYNFKDTLAVIAHCKLLLESYDLKLKMYQAVMAEQHGNVVSTILAYVRKVRQDMSKVTTYLFELCSI